MALITRKLAIEISATVRLGFGRDAGDRGSRRGTGIDLSMSAGASVSASRDEDTLLPPPTPSAIVGAGRVIDIEAEYVCPADRPAVSGRSGGRRPYMGIDKTMRSLRGPTTDFYV